MTRKRSKDTAIKEVTAQGRTRYRVVADTGFHADGRRRQTTKTFDTRKEARAWLDRLRTEVADGAFVARDRRSVSDLIDAWLASHRHIKPSTRQSYEVSLGHAKAGIGHLPAQDVTRAEVERLVTSLLAGTLQGGRTRSPSTVALTVGLLRQVFRYAVEDGWCRSNLAEKVKVTRGDKPEMQCWTREQRAAFLAHTATDPLAAGWLLTCVGLRRGEVLGLRWEDVVLEGDSPTITIRRTRGVVRREVIEGDPKSKRSRRTLPLSGLPGAVTVLRAARKQQMEHRLAAGPAYSEGGYIVADALGRPIHPYAYSKRFRALCTDAEVPTIRLHDARHTSVTLMLNAGVPLHVVAAWHGHDPVMALAVYGHAQPDWLSNAGAALAL